MKKFTFKGVLDGFRSSVQQQSKPEQEIQETLRVDHFLLRKTFRHGFPNSPTALAYDPVQKLLVIGDKTGSLRFLGRPGVDTHVRHEGDSACAVVCIEFLVNEGALVTATADDTLHLWNFRQKTPQVVQSLKFQRERITCLHLPVASKWLYVGTEKGNIHVVHIEKFALSGYIINWNKAIEVVRTTHPGAVVQLVDNPLDANKLLIAYESGQIVLWDLRGKSAEMRWQSAEPLRSVAWHHEGKNFVSSHTDGSLCTWPLRPSPKPAMLSFPHAKTNKEGKLEACKPIHKVDLRTAATGETYTIFSGGLSIEKGGKSPCITVIQGKSTTVLEMEHPVVDFITICESPWASEMQEPYAIAVLLQNDLVLIDLLTAGFPCFESPYPMDLHESPVTCCTYLADCPSDLVPAFYSVGRIPGARRTTIFSNREWPVSGGEWSPASCSYSEIVITGHQDGSIKFWDSSAGTLQILYKLKTGKIFERPRTRSVDGSDDDPLAVQIISLCAESRRLCVAGTSGHVILFKFRKSECTAETLVLEIPISYESFDDQPDASPECEFVPRTVTVPSKVADPNVGDAAADRKFDGMLRVRPGPQRKPAGFQAQLVCLTPWTNATHPGQITSLSINSSYGLMAYGTEHGLVIVDFVQKVCLVNVASPDLYGTQDPYSRMPRSPKQRTDLQYRSAMSTDEQGRSPSIDQLSSEGGSATTTLGVSPKGAKSSSISIAGNSRPESPGDTLESPTGIGEVPSSNAASQGRRKSTGWKAFNLKRQLSKVNMKLAFNNNTDGTKRSTTELSPVEISPAISSGDTGPGSSTPTPTSETLDQDKSDYIEQLEKDIVSSLNENEDTTDQTPTEEAQLELPQQFPPQQRKEKKRVDFCADNEMSRPSDLPLSLDELEIDDDATDTEDYDFTPQPPPRYKKRIVDKQRLLSVPNIKYVKQDFLPVQDLRKTSASAACGVSSITGSGMSRSVVAGSYSGGGVGGTGVSGGGGGSGQTGSVSMAGSLIRRFNLCELAHQLLYLAYERCQKYYINVFVGCKRNDKLDSSFSRSRSSSMSSLENITSEAVTCISFADSYTKKSDPSALIPTLWVGTSLGSVLTVSIILPDAECRKLQPVVVSILGGPIFRLKGPILSMSFLDCNGALIPYSYEAWRDDNRPDSRSGGSITAISAGSVEKSRDRTPTKNPNRMSPTLGAAGGIAGGGGVVGGGVSSIDSYGSDRQFIAITSEKQSRVVALPSQYCAYRQQIASESDFVIKAEIISVKESVCLACYLSTGHLQAYSLPSLRLLLDFDFLPLHDLSFQTKCKQGIVDPMLSIWGQQLIVHEDTNQIGKTFCFSNKGHGLYLATPTELQKFTICSEFCNYFNEMMGELFSPHDMPEPPKESFFKGLFGGGPRNLDREELFGESSGKANRSVAKHIPGPNLEQLGARASTATSEIARAHMLAMERGDKLNRLEESSERMANQAQEFGSSAHSLMLKYKDKKWYQL